MGLGPSLVDAGGLTGEGDRRHLAGPRVSKQAKRESCTAISSTGPCTESSLEAPAVRFENSIRSGGREDLAAVGARCSSSHDHTGGLPRRKFNRGRARGRALDAPPPCESQRGDSALRESHCATHARSCRVAHGRCPAPPNVGQACPLRPKGSLYHNVLCRLILSLVPYLDRWAPISAQEP